MIFLISTDGGHHRTGISVDPLEPDDYRFKSVDNLSGSIKQIVAFFDGEKLGIPNEFRLLEKEVENTKNDESIKRRNWSEARRKEKSDQILAELDAFLKYGKE
jgi:hypothetical protein